MATKLMSMRKVMPRKDSMDSIQQSKRRNGDNRAYEVLMQAQQHWFNMQKFRENRERCKRYCYGDQWKDVVTVDGKTLTEEEYIKEQGNIPLKNNLIRRLVRNVLGVYRNQSKEPTCTARDREEQKIGETMSTVLQYNMQQNRMNELYARSMEEFLISGLIVHRKWFGWRNEKLDCWTDYVQPNNFFVDANMRDFRGWDVSCIGEIHDISFQSLCSQFAETPNDYNNLATIYSGARDAEHVVSYYNSFGMPQLKNLSFLLPTEHNLCRVIEVWRKESKPRYRCHDPNDGSVYKIDIEDYHEMVELENASRIERGTQFKMDIEDIPLIKATWFIDDYWYFYFLSPFGDILKEGETPFAHKGNPYVFKAYPFIDGEIHSFVADVIDQQRYTNRLITMYDWIMRSSAKGMLLFPEENLPEHMSLEDVAEEWSRYNGILAIRTKGTDRMPQQISTNNTNIGIDNLLNLQLKFFEDISGVNGALQGKPGYSGTSGSLYAQQTQNATTSLSDLLESFGDFVMNAAYMDVKNIQQYYDSKRVFNIVGRKGALTIYDPDRIRDAEFDLSITESTLTPAYRQIANDFIMQLWQSGQITLQEMLENGYFPFSDQLLQAINSRQQEQIQQMVGGQNTLPMPQPPQGQPPAQQSA